VGRRALVIAIQEYRSVTDGSVARALPGTLQAGTDFRDWLISKWNSENVAMADRQLIFCSAPVVTGGRSATPSDILRALLELKTAGQNATDEFYFFFSGHGFSFVEPDTRSDMLIASDYEAMELSGASCMNLDKAIYWLRQQLGPGKQYYFIDACRNELDARRIRPTGFLLPNDLQTTGEATTYLLQSTPPSSTAAVDGHFSEALLAGLKGKSTAKTWDENDAEAMMVRYDTLRLYLKDRMRPQHVHHRVEGIDGEAEGIIARIKPAPFSTCTVRIEGCGDEFAGFVTSTGRRDKQDTQTRVTSNMTQFALKPDQYKVVLHLEGKRLRKGICDVMIYDDALLTFECETDTTSPQVPEVSEATVAEIVVPPQSTLELHELQTGSRTIFQDSATAAIEKGRYAAILRDSDGRIVKSDDFAVDSESRLVNLANWSGSLPQVSIAAWFPNSNGGIGFSESLGGYLSDPDLGVWLAIVGAGRILAGSPNTDFSKIDRLPLQNFSSQVAGSSPIYVLAGVHDPDTVLHVAISSDARPATWQMARQPEGLAGIREFISLPKAGPQFMSFRIGKATAYTVTSLASPNRATFVTLTVGHDGLLTVAQYLLPIGHLRAQLNPVVAEQLEWRNQLADVKMLAESSRAFRNRRDVSNSVPDHFLTDILYTKWLDPIASTLVAYELIRRGRTEMLPIVVRNLETYFPDLPDTPALARLAGLGTGNYLSVPLFLDGLRAFNDIEERLPLPSANLDYNSPWTAWRGPGFSSDDPG